METNTLIQLVQRIRTGRHETQEIEVKSAAKNCPTRLYDTLSSFSNQDGGGIILFGLDERNGFKVNGVYDVQDLQHRVAEQCKQMEPEVRALFTVAEIDGKYVVAAEVPGADPMVRPVFYRGTGRIRGAFTRVGDADEPMTEYEVYCIDAYKRRIQQDCRIAERAGRGDLDEEKLGMFLAKAKTGRHHLARNVPDERILDILGITVDGRPTIAGLLLFCPYPQGFFPQFSVTAVVVTGDALGDVDGDGRRFRDNRRMTGTLIEVLEDSIDFVVRNMRTSVTIDNRGVRHDETDYPIEAVREAILNALVHRDYGPYAENAPVQIRMFRDRMEIISPGGIYGNEPIERLGNANFQTRNAVLANLLEAMEATENRYSGIPTIRRACREHGLPEPVFTSKHGEFKVVFKTGDYQEPQKAVNAILRESGTEAEGCVFRCKGRNAEAFGLPEGRGIRVMAGARVSPGVSASFATRAPAYHALRQRLENEGVIRDGGFTRDWLFDSASAAASVVLGRNANGRDFWKRVEADGE